MDIGGPEHRAYSTVQWQLYNRTFGCGGGNIACRDERRLAVTDESNLEVFCHGPSNDITHPITTTWWQVINTTQM